MHNKNKSNPKYSSYVNQNQILKVSEPEEHSDMLQEIG